MPYHATPEFSKLVQICAVEGTIWRFLAGMKTSGASLPRAALVKMCVKEPVRCFLPPRRVYPGHFVGFYIEKKNSFITFQMYCSINGTH
jgi:hypothetical protein